jgi:hypothetical protein
MYYTYSKNMTSTLHDFCETSNGEVLKAMVASGHLRLLLLGYPSSIVAQVFKLFWPLLIPLCLSVGCLLSINSHNPCLFYIWLGSFLPTPTLFIFFSLNTSSELRSNLTTGQAKPQASFIHRLPCLQLWEKTTIGMLTISSNTILLGTSKWAQFAQLTLTYIHSAANTNCI